MKTIETIAKVTAEGQITVQLPPDIPAGEHRVVVVIGEKPLSPKPEIKEKLRRVSCAATTGEAACRQTSPLKFSAYPVGLVSENVTFRREDLYANDCGNLGGII